MEDWNVNKTPEQRESIRRRKATRNSEAKRSAKRNFRKNRFGNSFSPITNGMSEDIPTSGEGWTLN